MGKSKHIFIVFVLLNEMLQLESLRVSRKKLACFIHGQFFDLFYYLRLERQKLACLEYWAFMN